MAELIDGKQIAQEVLAIVKAKTAELLSEKGVKPGLAIILVGEDPASRTYVSSKARMAEKCGFLSVHHALPADAAEDEVASLLETLNADAAIHGILVQLPLPAHIDSGRIIQLVAPGKDVDGFGFVNTGKLGAGEFGSAFLPCTPAGCMLLIERARGRNLAGLNALVVGRSNLVGKPMANLLLAANCTVTIAHSHTKELASFVRNADIVVTAAGNPELIKGDWIKPGATVIDVGINRIPAPERGEGKTRLVGDVEYATAEKTAGAITPVPGGVGPMTIAMLMANTIISACRASGLEEPVFRAA